MPGIIARKWPLAIRLVELLHTKPDIWGPYKELFLPERIQTEVTMTLEEAKQRLQLAPFQVDMDGFAAMHFHTQAEFAKSLKVAYNLARLVLPSVDITPEKLTWAFTVVQTRADGHNGGAELIPLFDMFNHAATKACDFYKVSVRMCAPIRASMAMDADRGQLRAACAKDSGVPELLYRGQQLLGHLDDCVILLAPPCGLRKGDETFIKYHDLTECSPLETLHFLMTYGFYPAEKASR